MAGNNHASAASSDTRPSAWLTKCSAMLHHSTRPDASRQRGSSGDFSVVNASALKATAALVRVRQAAVTAIFANAPEAMRCCHSFGPVSCTDTPFESTATVTGMSFTSNS